MAATEHTYIVEGMRCDSCKRSVTEEVEEVRGIEAVDVDVARQRLTVRGNDVADAEVRAAVENAGYRVAA